jgi:hypothetical protein
MTQPERADPVPIELPPPGPASYEQTAQRARLHATLIAAQRAQLDCPCKAIYSECRCRR